jgi:hypothetical protein
MKTFGTKFLVTARELLSQLSSAVFWASMTSPIGISPNVRKHRRSLDLPFWSTSQTFYMVSGLPSSQGSAVGGGATGSTRRYQQHRKARRQLLVMPERKDRLPQRRYRPPRNHRFLLYRRRRPGRVAFRVLSANSQRLGLAPPRFVRPDRTSHAALRLGRRRRAPVRFSANGW